MVTNDIIPLPTILLTKTYYVLYEETTYTYDKDGKNTSDELSDTGKRKTSVKLLLFI
jgi:hypothetical protein